MKYIEKKDKRKIVLSLLIAMAFILPATSAFGSNLEEVDASDEQIVMENIGETTPTNFEVNLAESFDGQSRLVVPTATMDPGDCEVRIDGIAMLGSMSVGCYDIEIDICKEAIPPGCCPDCEVKVFADIFKVVPIPREEIYCTDFEDTADIYNNWDSIDGDGGPGGIDTWTWSDQRYQSAGHSFRCTQFNDGYLGNQLDYLQTTFFNTEGYDEIEVTFWNWCEGEFIDTGNGDILEDYGWVEYKLDSGPWTDDLGAYFYDNDWEKVSLNITGTSSVCTIGIRFAWTSGPTVQNEGWYVDDVCLYGRRSPDEYHVFQTHSIGSILVDDPCVTYIFPETWCPDEGEYIINIWMLIEPDSSCITLHPQTSPFIHIVEIGDVADIAVTANAYAGTSPFEMEDNLVVSATVENIGTVDAINLPVTLSVQMQIKTYLLDDYMEAGEGDWGWMFIEGGIPEQMFHLTELKSYSPTHSWTNQDETTGNYEIMANALLAPPINPFEGDPIDLDFSAMINYKLDKGGDITPVFRASTYYWDISVGLDRDPPIMGPASSAGWIPASFNDYVTSISSYWEESYFGPCDSFIDLLHKMNERYGPPGQNVEDFSEIEIGFLFEALTTPGSSGDTGLFIDNARITKITPGAEVYKEVIIVDELTAETPSTPPGTANLVYEWENMPTGDYVETVSIPPDDNIDNNEMALTFSVVTDIAEADETDVESYDYTKGARSHWHITTSGYDNYLWCGDESTGTYGDDWNDAVIFAEAASSAMDWSFGGPVIFDLDEYSETEVGWDELLMEINPYVNDPGYQWYTYDPTPTPILWEDFETRIHLEYLIDGDISEWTEEYKWFTDNEGNEIFGGEPEFTYYKGTDGEYLYFAIIVNDPTPLEEANDDMWLAFRLDDGDNYPVFRKGYKTDPSEYGQLSETGAYGAYGPLPPDVEFAWSIDESHIYYEWKIPLAFLGVSMGDTIKYLTHVREWSVKALNYHPEIIDNENKYWPYADINQFGDLSTGVAPFAAPLWISTDLTGMGQGWLQAMYGTFPYEPGYYIPSLVISPIQYATSNMLFRGAPVDESIMFGPMDWTLYPANTIDFTTIFVVSPLTNNLEVNVYSGIVPVLEAAISPVIDYNTPDNVGYITGEPYCISEFTLDAQHTVLADPANVWVEFYHNAAPWYGVEVFGIDDMFWDGNALPQPGSSNYGWRHTTYSFTPDMFKNPLTGVDFGTDIGGFTNDMGFRLRFVSDDSYHERGVLVDNLHIHDGMGGDIFLSNPGPDPCDNMDNLLLDPIIGGDWWTQTDSAQWTCMDLVSMLIPNDINNALVWDTSVPQAYTAELHFTHQGILEDGEDYVFLEISTDGGSSWIAPVAYTGTFGPLTETIDMTSFIGENVLIRWRVVTNEDTPSDSYVVEDMYITGQVDLNPPVTTGTFAGTVIHGWYSTPVTMTLTAVDDLTGVKDIFYTIDGGSQKTYSTPVSISSNGDHTVEFWSVDNVNNEETPHHTVSFKIDTGDGPSVDITAPTDGLYLFGKKLLDLSEKIFIIGSFTIEATASDVDSGVISVEFFLDGISIGSDTSSPYSILCGAKHRGAGTIKAVAKDFAGNEAQDTLDITYYKFL